MAVTQKNKDEESKLPSSFVLRMSNLLKDSGAERGVRAEWAAALQGLRELIGLSEVFQRVRIINTIVEAALA